MHPIIKSKCVIWQPGPFVRGLGLSLGRIRRQTPGLPKPTGPPGKVAFGRGQLGGRNAGCRSEKAPGLGQWGCGPAAWWMMLVPTLFGHLLAYGALLFVC